MYCTTFPPRHFLEKYRKIQKLPLALKCWYFTKPFQLSSPSESIGDVSWFYSNIILPLLRICWCDVYIKELIIKSSPSLRCSEDQRIILTFSRYLKFVILFSIDSKGKTGQRYTTIFIILLKYSCERQPSWLIIMISHFIFRVKSFSDLGKIKTWVLWLGGAVG